jgi:hypothetical protein
MVWIQINGGLSLGQSRLELGCRTRRRRSIVNFSFLMWNLLAAFT